MTALIVIGILLLVLLALSLVRVGGMVEYSTEGLTAKARIGPLKIALYPRPPKKKRAEKGKKKPSGPKGEKPKAE